MRRQQQYVWASAFQGSNVRDGVPLLFGCTSCWLYPLFCFTEIHTRYSRETLMVCAGMTSGWRVYFKLVAGFPVRSIYTCETAKAGTSCSKDVILWQPRCQQTGTERHAAQSEVLSFGMLLLC